ncbi:MAG: SigB/SigF/SigG family RNA polymerase sigma factor [Eubacterium sp.]|jgi:RNA polymerase sigma-B factor|nr:SigB/SigF/SigG family RNA polymerase sigma factor [Eubacterium sp.]MCH4046862.1 SigB/SigF/SigG family RNA polymerase sigma factor [Eubacterium sp.]MCH4079959.1 SigB/SigF/SigG family RNA polymerase sigma factor [Eubacterium sp.]MCH4109999.1 SigB/SigF/SigG family RNA polymerase sigma factor [Eubacterium sp.]MCI1307569.1 SigB/SigF/SigG family RNA polymerase sigma factor [Eubacterium sp.]
MSDLQEFVKYKENPTIEKRNELVESHLYMVDILIRKYLNKGVDYDDLYQVGALALVQAVERFDPSRGFEFSSFATPTILGEIKKYFRDKQWSLKVPRRLKEIASKVQKAKEELYSKNHKQPTIPEIAEYTGFTEEQIIESMEGSQAYGTYSLDKTFEDAGEDGESAFLEKYTGFDEKGFDRVEMSDIIDTVLEKLSDQNKYIFRERFIFNRSQSSIAKTLGVSQMTISRAERNIIKQFREELHRK